MRMLQESDIYSYLNKDNVINKQTLKILSGEMTVVKSEVQPILDTIKKVFKDTAVVKMLAAVDKDEIVMFYTTAEINLPTCLPFIKYKANGKERVAVNLSKYLTIRRDRATGETEYNIDTKKLYCLLMPAFIYLRLFDKQAVLSSEALELSANIWARMFTKVLNMAIGLSTNKDRYDGFMYFAIMFFCKYYMESPEEVSKQIANKYMDGKDRYFVDLVEAKCEQANINMYTSFTDFAQTLFNSEFTNVRSIRVSNVSDALNSQFFVKKFISLYDFPSLFSLASYPYFLFTIMSAFTWSYINNPRSFEDVCMNEKEWGKLMVCFYKEL